MRILPLALLLGAVLAPTARADKFHLGDANAEKRVAAGANPDVLEGVLLAESATQYHVRIVGGEIWLQKRLVYKVERDGLTLADIVRAEAALARQQQEAPAAVDAAVQGMRGRPVEAAVATPADVAPVAAAVAPVAPAFDPVIGRAVSGAALGDAGLQRELKFAYSMTGDRQYLKLLRQVRRMR